MHIHFKNSDLGICTLKEEAVEDERNKLVQELAEYINVLKCKQDEAG